MSSFLFCSCGDCQCTVSPSVSRQGLLWGLEAPPGGSASWKERSPWKRRCCPPGARGEDGREAAGAPGGSPHASQHTAGREREREETGEHLAGREAPQSLSLPLPFSPSSHKHSTGSLPHKGPLFLQPPHISSVEQAVRLCSSSTSTTSSSSTGEERKVTRIEGAGGGGGRWRSHPQHLQHQQGPLPSTQGHQVGTQERRGSWWVWLGGKPLPSTPCWST